ncbi:hypothetical protein [Jannaschia formosa]|uniref:hypothetical protein n=1 Tax=Jannaschia formosa TaxID=2259592 RepID=UPI000E1BA532|nr:hypothetical protein [Jannaschia formosa]TFL16406.1 hypothetical protein DR046_19990 [Jannaschia formosa]
MTAPAIAHPRRAIAIAQARARVANPDPSDSPGLRMLAWQVAKSAHGHCVRQTVATRPAAPRGDAAPCLILVQG